MHSDTNLDEDFHPTPEPKSNLIYAAYMAKDKHGTIYTDLTGPFPVTSMDGNKYILVIYVYDSNAILLRPLKNRSDNETLRAYTEVYEFLKTRNCHPKLHVLDNEASKALKRLITTQNAVFQFVEAYDHRVNAAE